MIRFKLFVAGSFLIFSSAVSAKSSLENTDLNLKNEIKSKALNNHHSVGYDRARTYLLGEMYLTQINNQYFVKDVYCEANYLSPGPGLIPKNDVMNVEHTWPQSKFGKKLGDKSVKKADLHHLYPSDSEMNNIRGNNYFGVVTAPIKVTKCPQSQIGDNSDGQRVFEPPAGHRGNVARAIFYFSIRYSMPVEAFEEEILKHWNLEDPVDMDEIDRNNQIEKYQGNRNPFIDDPNLVKQVNDF